MARWIVGLLIVMVARASAAPAGLAWTAQPAIVQRDHGVALRWTIEARSATKHVAALPCVWFGVMQEFGHFVDGAFVVDGTGLRRVPDGECADGTPSKPVLAWRTELAAATDDLAHAGDHVRVRLQVYVGDEPAFDAAVVMLVVSDRGKATITRVSP